MQTTRNGDPKVLIALDFADEQQALALVAQLDPAQCRLKVGKEDVYPVRP
ncbi:hypothetical protein MBH78_21450 [Oceanimonas sp. NS1]|nr:hypothetical protein [Oceanimonas sp. NS1]